MDMKVSIEEFEDDEDPRGDVPFAKGLEDFELSDDAGRDGDGEPFVDPQPAETVLGLREWDAGDHVDVPPPREWLLGNQFCRRFLSRVLAPGAPGQTALRTLQSLSLATGRPRTGEHVFKRCRVLLLSMEDDDSELRRRLAAA